MAKAKKYTVLKGLSFGDTRYEVGEVAGDIPKTSIKWLLEDQAIELASEDQSNDESEEG